MRLKKVSIQNFRSIKTCIDLELNDINILIGSNGVGKSNFIKFFTMVRKIAESDLQNFVAENGYANKILYFGRKESDFIYGKLSFEKGNAYEFHLLPNNEDMLYFGRERAYFNSYSEDIGQGGHSETKINAEISQHFYSSGGVTGYTKKGLESFEAYHFHDTSPKAPIKQACYLHDNHYLRRNGSNLAAFLYFIQEKHPFVFKKITRTIKNIAPFFDEFILVPDRVNEDQIRLQWKERGSDMIFGTNELSDGTIRMIGLATLLLQPEPNDTIIIDEPELGLHPAAVHLLAELIKQCSQKSQVIVSTQSVTLVNQFTPEDIIVAEREEKQTVFKRVSNESISDWLDAYALGDAWEKNLLGGTP